MELLNYALHRPIAGVLDLREEQGSGALFLLNGNAEILFCPGAEQACFGESFFAHHPTSPGERAALSAHLSACSASHFLHTLYGAPALFLGGGLFRAGVLPVILPPPELAQRLLCGCPEGVLEGLQISSALRAAPTAPMPEALEEVAAWYLTYARPVTPIPACADPVAWRDALIAKCECLAALFSVRLHYDFGGLNASVIQSMDLPCCLGVLMLLFAAACRMGETRTVELSISESYPAKPMLTARLLRESADGAGEIFETLKQVFAVRGGMCEVLYGELDHTQILVRVCPCQFELSAQGVKEENLLLHAASEREAVPPSILFGSLLHAKELQWEEE